MATREVSKIDAGAATAYSNWRRRFGLECWERSARLLTSVHSLEAGKAVGCSMTIASVEPSCCGTRIILVAVWSC